MKLYHATYRQYLESIFSNGLNGDYGIKNWEDSKSRVIYLATEPELAIAFAESSESVPDEFLDNIVVLEVDSSELDIEKLFIDENIIFDPDEDIYSFEYHGAIQPELIHII